MISINLCINSLESIGSPNYVHFDEGKKEIKALSSTSNCGNPIRINKTSNQIHVRLLYTPVSDIIGKWNYEIDDMSIFLTEKQI